MSFRFWRVLLRPLARWINRLPDEAQIGVMLVVSAGVGALLGGAFGLVTQGDPVQGAIAGLIALVGAALFVWALGDAADAEPTGGDRK